MAGFVVHMHKRCLGPVKERKYQAVSIEPRREAHKKTKGAPAFQ